MPDITMCNGVTTENGPCPMRNSCYRFLATPSEYRQSYFVESPFILEPDGTSCEYFWKIESMEQYKQLQRSTK